MSLPQLVPLTGWMIVRMDTNQKFEGWSVYAHKPDDPNAIPVTIISGHLRKELKKIRSQFPHGSQREPWEMQP